MSLDVFLTMPGTKQRYEARIFVGEDGSTKELSREEWDWRFPGTEPVVMEYAKDNNVFSANITHNLWEMAEEAGIYEACWRPEEIGITKARQLIEPLRAGMAKLLAEPETYKLFDSPNGFGLYKHFVPWVQAYLAACEKYPDADVSVCR